MSACFPVPLGSVPAGLDRGRGGARDTFCVGAGAFEARGCGRGQALGLRLVVDGGGVVGRVGLVRGGVVGRVRGEDVVGDGGVAVDVRALGGAVRDVRGRQRDLARGDVDAGEGAVQQRQADERLVKGHFVAGFVDAHEAEGARGHDLAVYDVVVVGRADVDEPGRAVGVGFDVG